MAKEQILGHQKSSVAHLGNTNVARRPELLKMTIEIVDLPIKKGDFP